MTLADGPVYDDQPCPKRWGGLTHTQNGHSRCTTCDRVCYSGTTRKAIQISWPKSDTPPLGVDLPSKSSGCWFSTCDSKTTIRCDLKLWRTLAGADPLLDFEARESWLCFEHSRLVEDAMKRTAIRVRRSIEGWIWIDNLDFMRFASW